MILTIKHYGIWVPCAINMPVLPARPGGTRRFTLEGIDIQAIFAPGHSLEKVVFIMELPTRETGASEKVRIPVRFLI